MKNTKVDDLTEEELKKFLEENQDIEKADIDGDGIPDNLEEVEVTEEITVLPPKQEKKVARAKTKEEKKVEKYRQKAIKKRKKQLKKNPTTLKRYEPDPSFGLTNEIAEERIIDGFNNKSVENKTKSIPKIIFTNIVSFFNIMMFLIAGALIAVGAYTDLIFLAIVTANILIGIIQEIKAKSMIDSLSLISAPVALVVREGQEIEVDTNEVVLDDIMILSTGNQICADSIVVYGAIEVNESLLTGESDAIIKKPGDSLYSGSFVVSGKCKVRVDKVGKDNYIEKLSGQVKSYKKPKSDLLNSLSLIIRIMAVPVIVLGGTLFLIMYYRNGDYTGDIVNCIRKTAGAMIGMIPSGLFLMSSIALMVGVIRLGQRNVLVQELYCIEMLARVNCICLDKTGTITDGTMVVKNVIEYNSVNGLATRNVISAMLNALPDRNLTSQALKEKFGLGKRIRHIATIPFSSQRKLQAVTFDKYGTYILGAPEFVLSNTFNIYKKDVDKYAALGYRVLCLAYNPESIKNGNLPEGENQVVSMILIEDTIRPDAINTIRYFKESGVEVRVISGDNPITVSKIALRAGITGAEKYISLDGLSDNEVRRAALKYNVFGRVSPKQKQILIKTLKESGRTVAMTGDGVNDILALREADCSIAVASGSEAARNCSHLVLLDSNFDSMPFVVSEGRRVINNVTKVSSLFLTKTIFSLFLAIEAVITGSYPISTNQLFLIDTLAIGLPSLLLVNEPNNNPVKGKFLYNVIKEALPGAITILLLSMIVFGLASQMYLDIITRNTIIIVAATHTCLMVLYKACKPFNLLHGVLFATCYALFLFAILLMPKFLEIRPLVPISEYNSDNYSITSINHYPSVDKSIEGIYVVDGKVTSISTTANDNGTDLYIVDGDADDKNEVGKIYYSFSPSSTDETGAYTKKLRLDTQVNIPTLSYTLTGNILLGGYEITNKPYSDAALSTLRADSNGKLYFGTPGETNPIRILLTKSNSKYNYEIKYGVYNKENAEFDASILPEVVVSKDGEYIINGQKSTEYKYKAPSNITFSSSLQLSLQENEDYSYTLLVNGSPIYATYTKDGTVSKTPYKVELPKVSTNANKSDNSGALYLSGLDSGRTIFEVYGKETTDDKNNTDPLDDELLYTITDYNGHEYTYNDTTKEILVDGVKPAESFVFKNLKTKGFTDYYDKDNKKINIYDSTDELAVYINKDSKNIYDTYYSLMKFSRETKNYTKIGDNLRTPVSINNTSMRPQLEISEANHFIIDGYYTKYIVNSADLNPVLTSDNYLVICGVETDYQLSSNYITVSKGGEVKMINLSSLIFLLMLCLLSGPLMKIFQYFVPWTTAGSRYVVKGINKIGTKDNKDNDDSQ